HSVERQAPLTGAVRWDGVAVLVISKLVTPLFVEFLGGVNCNSGAEKAQSDEEKMILRLTNLLKPTDNTLLLAFSL
ncbi:hypothetical protein K501DRAFT_196347, partial [Backusella circina FSU 941]